MKALRLQQVVQTVQTYFDKQFSRKSFWCHAEVLQAKVHKTRVYFDLVEYDVHWAILAKMKAIVREYALLEIYLSAHGLNSVEELIGKVVLCEAVCSFHAQWWLSLHIEAFSHEFARGQLHTQQESTRKRLREQGIYEANKQQVFGLPPVRLAVISSVNSEWYRDFLTILEQSGWNIVVEFFPATMHGEEAKKDVTAQLAVIAQQATRFHAVILTRWGGGSDSLVWQNDFHIAEAICRLPIPFILATGHTADRSLLDEIVWHAAKTPSDAAHLIIDGIEQMAHRLETVYEVIMTQIEDRKAQYSKDVKKRADDIQLFGAHLCWRLEERVKGWWTTIQALHPDQQVHRGYALLTTSQGTYLTKPMLPNLNKGDRLHVRVYTYELSVTIDEVVAVQKNVGKCM